MLTRDAAVQAGSDTTPTRTSVEGWVERGSESGGTVEIEPRCTLDVIDV